MPDAPIPNFPLERQRALARRSYAILALGLLIPPLAWLWDAALAGSPYDPGRWANYRATDAAGGWSATISYEARPEADGRARVVVTEQALGGEPRETAVLADRASGARADAPAESLAFFAPSHLGAFALAGAGVAERLESGEFARRFRAFPEADAPPLLWAPAAASEAVGVHVHPRYGPRTALTRHARDASGTVVGTAIHDAKTGLLLRLETYGAEGGRALSLWATAVPLRRASGYAFGGVALYALAWGAAHLVAMRRAGFLDAIDARAAARFFIRLMAFPVFDWASALHLPATALCFLFPAPERAMLAADVLGLLLLLYAIGPYALLVLPKFVGYLPGVGDAFYVPFFGFAVLASMLVKYARRPTRSVLWPL